MSPSWFIALWVLNLLDAISTLIGLQAGLFVEVNPVMDLAYQVHPALFLTTKLVLVTVSAVILYRFRAFRLVRILAPMCVIAYLSIVLWHVVMWACVA